MERIIFRLKIILNKDNIVFRTNKKTRIPTEPKKFFKRKTIFLLKDKKGDHKKNSFLSGFVSNTAGIQNIVTNVNAQKTLKAYSTQRFIALSCS